MKKILEMLGRGEKFHPKQNERATDQAATFDQLPIAPETVVDFLTPPNEPSGEDNSFTKTNGDHL
jgi:hypothetical protein